MGDTIIVATALVHEEPVLTRNVKHFERIGGVGIESY
jgi:tRNA(fMet)-specific endonuclease VapC